MECTEPRIWKQLSDSQEEGGEPSVQKDGNEHPGLGGGGGGGARKKPKVYQEGKPNLTKSLSQNSNVVCFGCEQLVTLRGSVLQNS